MGRKKGASANNAPGKRKSEMKENEIALKKLPKLDVTSSSRKRERSNLTFVERKGWRALLPIIVRGHYRQISTDSVKGASANNSSPGKRSGEMKENEFAPKKLQKLDVTSTGRNRERSNLTINESKKVISLAQYLSIRELKKSMPMSSNSQQTKEVTSAITAENKIEVTDQESMQAQIACSTNCQSQLNVASGRLAAVETTLISEDTKDNILSQTRSSNRISFDHRPLSVVGYQQLCESDTNSVVFWSQDGIVDVGSLMLASPNRSILVTSDSVEEIAKRTANPSVVQCILRTRDSGDLIVNVLSFGKKPLPFAGNIAYPTEDFEAYIRTFMLLNKATNLSHVARYESDIDGKGLYQTLCKEFSENVIGTNCDMAIPSRDV